MMFFYCGKKRSPFSFKTHNCVLHKIVKRAFGRKLFLYNFFLKKPCRVFVSFFNELISFNSNFHFTKFVICLIYKFLLYTNMDNFENNNQILLSSYNQTIVNTGLYFERIFRSVYILMLVLKKIYRKPKK